MTAWDPFFYVSSSAPGLNNTQKPIYSHCSFGGLSECVMSLGMIMANNDLEPIALSPNRGNLCLFDILKRCLTFGVNQKS
jgi:hypothetical protein